MWLLPLFNYTIRYKIIQKLLSAYYQFCEQNTSLVNRIFEKDLQNGQHFETGGSLKILTCTPHSTFVRSTLIPNFKTIGQGVLPYLRKRPKKGSHFETGGKLQNPDTYNTFPSYQVNFN